jgi:hypothetical protein
VSGPGDFDFLVGSWKINNRRLKQPLAASNEWDEFTSTSVCRRAFDGAANFDEISIPERGFSGLTLRLFDPERKEWSLYWASSRDGRLQPPVVGRFADGVGTFYSRETYNGADITVRFIWSDITPHSARWEQAFSSDEGMTWETNWIMEFTKRSQPTWT